jgi:hypothetical protein
MRFQILLFLILSVGAHAATPITTTDDQIKQQMISQSIAEYKGNCPCPYSTAKNGSNCGKRSVYSRPRGAKPLCFAKDITPTMIEKFKTK